MPRDDPLLRREIRQLKICRIVFLVIWVTNLVYILVYLEYLGKALREIFAPIQQQILASFDIYVCFRSLDDYVSCTRCLYKAYLTISLVVSILYLPLSFVTFVVVASQSERILRIYGVILFLISWLDLMVLVVLKHDYRVIGDVVRKWNSEQDLTFFEENYKCCGVLGPDDYKVFQIDVPVTCYKDQKRVPKNLYKNGCSTVTITHQMDIHTGVITCVEVLLILIMLIYYIFLRRINKRRNNVTESNT